MYQLTDEQKTDIRDFCTDVTQDIKNLREKRWLLPALESHTWNWFKRNYSCVREHERLVKGFVEYVFNCM